MAITDWPRAERPREKLIERGAGALSDAELLAIFLGSGRQGRDAVACARDLLAAEGGLARLLARDGPDLRRVGGLGAVGAARLTAALELARRFYATAIEDRDVLAAPAATSRYLSARLSGHTREVFACVFLDTRNRVLACEDLFYGTIDGATVHPREVVRRALAHNAQGVILAHNHPSGVAEPSSADVHLTRRLEEALALIGVRVLDHIVVGQAQTVSFAERGLL